MKRRNALVAFASLALVAAARTACAQSEPRAFRIGLLPDLDRATRKLFVAALQANGLSEGRDFVLIEPEPAPRIRVRMVAAPAKRASADLASVTRMLLAQKPDVVLATSTAYAAAAQHVSATIPVVMWTSGYPVEAGLAESLARPGKNVTGNSIYAGTGVWGKLLELVREASPALARVTVLWDYVPPAFARDEIAPAHAELGRAATKLGLRLDIVEISELAHVDAALAYAPHEPTALVVTSGWVLSSARERVMKFALEHQMPVIADFRWPASIEPYPLLTYAALQSDLMRTAADYAVRIARGARPAELPIQQPRRFELLINMKTARAVGLAIPQALRLQADMVIE